MTDHDNAGITRQQKQKPAAAPIARLLRDLAPQLLQPPVRRQQYSYDMAVALSNIEQIGRLRNPAFTLDDDNIFTYTNLVRYVMADPDYQALDPATGNPRPGRLNAGIYLAGSTGTGKSWAMEIMTIFARLDHTMIAINGKSRLLCWDNYRCPDLCATFAEQGSVRDITRRGIVGFQDLGAEPQETLYMGNRICLMASVIEERGDRGDCLTFFTSNLSWRNPELKARYGDRVISRLNEMCNYMELRGPDRRIQL